MRIYHREHVSLRKAGWQVTLLAHRLSENASDIEDGVVDLGIYRSGQFGRDFLQRIVRCWKCFSFALKVRPAVVHFYSPEFIPWARLLRQVLDTRLVFDCMEDFESYALQKVGLSDVGRRALHWVVSNQLKSCARVCDSIVCSDEWTAESLSRYGAKCTVIHNYPRVDLFPCLRGESHKEFDVVYHGSMPEYNLDMILKIDRILVEKGTKISWLLIGRVPRNSHFYAALKSSGSASRFRIIGIVPHDRVVYEFSKAKIGLIALPNLPKFHRNIPQKMFEYMAAGMPFVASDLKPIRKFNKDEECGFLCDTEDLESFAEKIRMLLHDTSLADSLGRNGREKVVNQFNWSQESGKLIDLYESLELHED